MDLEFNLKKMDETYMEALGYYHTFDNSVESLKKIIDSLPSSWESDETGTLEQFISLFQEKYNKLHDASVIMKKYCDYLEEKRLKYQDASLQVKNNFE